MARQEEIFAQTITDMKRAMARKAEDSEGDDFIEKPTNRGNKRKRGAAFVQEGRLDQANPLKRYKKTINYNGYMRDIISKNSFRLDPDGDVIDEEDVDSTMELSNLEEDPYKDVRIEDLLMPLTSAGALKDHPTLSLPYTSRALDEIIHSAQEMVQREQNNLFRLKQLASGLRGDASWMPVGAFESESDLALIAETTTHPSAPASVDTVDFAEQANAQEDANMACDTTNGAAVDDLSSLGPDGGSSAADRVGMAQAATNSTSNEALAISKGVRASGQNVAGPENQDAHIDHETAAKEVQHAIDADLEASGHSLIEQGAQAQRNGTMALHGSDNQQKAVPGDEQKPFDPDETMEDDSAPQVTGAAEDGINGEQPNGEGDDGEGDDDSQPQHRMTTRAKAAEAAYSPSLSAEDDADLPPHPFFLLPPTTFPGRDLGLPPAEAAETRRLMTAYIQRQEDAVANTWRLLKGLLKARQHRDDVMEWCTAEAHVGEMSDGEDWYDKDYWGLEGDLKKGEDVVEDEDQAMGVGGRKKTRRARAGG